MNARTLRHVLDGAEGLLWNIDFGVDGTEQFWRPLFFNIETAQRLLRLEARSPEQYAELWEASKLPDDRDRVRERYYQAIRDRETTFSVQYGSADRHGGLHWLRDHVRVQKTGERAWRFLIVTTDITHERRASDVVSRTLRVLAHTLDSSDTVLWSGDIPRDSSGKLNLALYNYPAAQLLLPLDVATPDAYVRAWQEAQSEEDRAEGEALFQNALARRETFYERRYACVDKNGTAWPVKENVRLEFSEDRVQIVRVSRIERTAPPAIPPVSPASDPLLQLSSVLARARCCIWYADARREGTKFRWEMHVPELADEFLEQLNRAADTDIRTSWLQGVPQRDKLALYRAAERALREGEDHFSHEFRIRRGDGVHLWLRNDVSLTATSETSWSVVVVVTDVTELHQAQETIQSILQNARCVLWFADIRRDPEGLNGFDWSFRLPDPAAARRLVDVDTDESLAWSVGMSQEDLDAMHARSCNALIDRLPGYSQLFKVRDRHGETRWLFEEVTLIALPDEVWSAVGVVTDVTTQQRALLELKASQERYRSFVEHLPVGVYRTTGEGRLTLANAALLTMLGYSTLEELLEGSPWADPGREDFWERVRTEGRVLGRDESWVCSGGERINVRENAMAVRDETTGTVVCFEGTVENVTERQKTHDLIRRQATHDPLTDLPNRSMAQSELEKLLTDAKAAHAKVGVLFVDLDKFKEVNDIHGHGTGDRLLVQIARRLKRATRPSDTVARTGGDEFLILTPDIIDADEANRLAQRVRRVVQEPAVIDGQRFELDTSIGTVIYPRDGEDPETLLRHADIAMYHAKSQGGGVRGFTASMHEEMRERITLEADMRRAITAREFVLYYQPQMDSVTSRLVGVEALVRWNHPERGLVPPIQFIPLAEETGLIVPLGEWVLREACRQGAEWHAKGMPMRMSVNVSAKQFAQRELPRIVASALDESRFRAESLDLELTESTLLEQERMVETSIAALRCLGVGLQIDDFGTGYSSLALLRRYRMEALKIDQGFIRGIRESQEDAAIVRSVIELAHTLGMMVIAEGVETEWHHECLRDLGADFVQGYHFSKPVPPEQILALTERFGLTQ